MFLTSWDNWIQIFWTSWHNWLQTFLRFWHNSIQKYWFCSSRKTKPPANSFVCKGLLLLSFVELEGVEPSSSQSIDKLSTMFSHQSDLDRQQVWRHTRYWSSLFLFRHGLRRHALMASLKVGWCGARCVLGVKREPQWLQNHWVIRQPWHSYYCHLKVVMCYIVTR